ncbi:MAG: phosphatase PAP2 family protein [Hyphomicrobiales bacterium]|nr:phosphatase PAP2 family protein [Hyphomicrobiales bacterium]
MAGERRNAVALARAFAFGLALIVSAKIVLMFFVDEGRLRSPSGHTALSTFFYGALAVAMLAQWRTGLARAGAALCGALVVAIALSRVALQVHTRSETLFGLVVGLLALWLFRRAWRPLRIRDATTWLGAALVGAAACAVVYAIFQLGFTDEEAIESIADWLRETMR